MPEDTLRTTREQIRAAGHAWSAGSTSVSELPNEVLKTMCGLAVDHDQLQATAKDIKDHDTRLAFEGVSLIYPRSWDWRNVNGRDWTTSVKDQYQCGSCVAFATVAAMESNLEIARRNPYLEPDLSEADLFFCGHGETCRGWSFVPALEYSREKGVPDEQCFPYPVDLDHPLPCKPCADRDSRVIKIRDWKELKTASETKDWLNRKGPVITGMAVYEDFYYYRGGIYRRTSEQLVGYHAVCAVGFDETEQYWIFKNSWGTAWGERGWFRISYGECGIGSDFYYYGVRMAQ